MNGLAEITEVVGFIDECLAESDWDRLAALQVPALAEVATYEPTQIVDALIAVQDMVQRVQARMDAIADELESAPTVRKAVRAYVRT